MHDDRLTTMRWLLLAVCLGGCATEETAVRLSVLYDDAWTLSELDVATGEHAARVEAAHELLVIVPDEQADRELVIEIAGLRDASRVALGRVVVTPIAGAEVSTTIVLTALACASLEAPPNASIEGGAGMAGEVATYACTEGFVLTGNGGSNMRTCESSGAWSGSDPSCGPVLSPCDPNPCTNGGTCEEDGASFVCACVPGYAGAACATRVACPTLGAPSNGSVNRTTGCYGDIATYGCDSGYAISNGGASTRTCEASAAWSGTEPTCEPLTTPCEPSPCANGGTCIALGPDFSCQCAPGFTGDTCSAALTCPTLSAPANGWIDRTTGTPGDVASYSCRSGYYLVGAGPGRTCGADGQWSGLAPSCEPTGGYPVWPIPGTVEHPPSYTTRTATVRDDVTGLEWQRSVPASSYSHTSAINYCHGLVLDGRSDWRLPTRIELMSILDYSERPTIDPLVFPSTPAGSDRFWTFSTLARDGTRAFQVGFEWGDATLESKSLERRVRCVRGGLVHAEPPSNRFSSSGTIVTDNFTGLVWSHSPVGEYTPSEGRWECELHGMRLPTLVELASIVDESGDPAIDASVFNVYGGWYWSSSPIASGFAAYVYFSDGTANNTASSLRYDVLCVQ
jgi:hypothetical protein